jgi:hypothetical protein
MSKSYNGIRALAKFSMCVNKYQQAFCHHFQGNNWHKDFDNNLDVCLFSAPLALVGLPLFC